jgi:hypothetical protein
MDPTLKKNRRSVETLNGSTDPPEPHLESIASQQQQTQLQLLSLSRQSERIWANNSHEELATDEIESTAANPITNNDNMSTQDALHSACRLSRGLCQPDS